MNERGRHFLLTAAFLFAFVAASLTAAGRGPADRSDGWSPKHRLNRIPEGLRFRLDPSVNVEALKC